MPDLHVSTVLPYYLRIAPGDYETGQEGEALRVIAPELSEGTPPQTQVGAHFTHANLAEEDKIEQQKGRDADQLLWRTNRLLRWYRTITHRAEMLELTRAQASPFRFVVLAGDADPRWVAPLRYEATGSRARDMTIDDITNRVRAGLAGGAEPDVADLFLLDAERALNQGRFRETVLFCWSTIDSVFNRKYDSLIVAALEGELAAARDFFTGVDFGLKNKMTAALYLVARRSLFREPGDLWQRLTGSYSKRNGIIHRGENATEDEARQAIAVARQIVEIMNALAVPEKESPSGGQPRRKRRKAPPAS